MNHRILCLSVALLLASPLVLAADKIDPVAGNFATAASPDPSAAGEAAGQAACRTRSNARFTARPIWNGSPGDLRWPQGRARAC